MKPNVKFPFHDHHNIIINQQLINILIAECSVLEFSRCVPNCVSTGYHMLLSMLHWLLLCESQGQKVNLTKSMLWYALLGSGHSCHVSRTIIITVICEFSELADCLSDSEFFQILSVQHCRANKVKKPVVSWTMVVYVYNNINSTIHKRTQSAWSICKKCGYYLLAYTANFGPDQLVFVC